MEDYLKVILPLNVKRKLTMNSAIKYIAFSFCLALSNILLAQNEAANWYFGNKAGVTFNNGSPLPLSGGKIETYEGCSTISDNNGNLMFYTDGVSVWNKNHDIMLNGTNLFGDISSTQSAIIVPKPLSNNIFYIFTVDDKAGENGLRYSEVDITLDNGLGGVTTTKNNLLASSTTEKITAVQSNDGINIWVISHLWNSNTYAAFLVTNSGVNTSPVLSNVGDMVSGDTSNTIGYMKASPDGKKIAFVKSYLNSYIELVDFNATTGVISNPIKIENFTFPTPGPYGCEFSANSKHLYVSETNINTSSSRLHKYNISLDTAEEINNSDILIYDGNSSSLAALQLAIDGNIYVAQHNKNSIGIISNPNEDGSLSTFAPNAVNLNSGTSTYGLPPFIQSYFFARNVFRYTCLGDATEFGIETSSVIDSIEWDFGDPASGANNSSTDLNPTHVFSSTGAFTVTITIQAEGETQYIYRTVNISLQPPVLTLDPLSGCDTGDGTAIFNLVNGLPDTVLNDPDLTYAFFESYTDADTFSNVILNANEYTNISDPQTIYVRLQNNSQSDCFSISELELQVLEAPIIEEVTTSFFCEDSSNAAAILDVGPLTQPLGNYSFLWLETQETTSQIQVSNPGTYTVRITLNSTITNENPDGCYVDRVITVSSSSIATIEDIVTHNGNSAEIFVSGLGDYEYALDDINGPYQPQPYFFNLEAGLHTVYVRDLNTCGIAEEIFSLIGFPLYFTPNNDGNNDTWQVKGISSQFQPNSKVHIYDRYGKLLKELDPLGIGWDGFFNGYPMPQDDYWFSVTLEDGRTYKDHFTLKR